MALLAIVDDARPPPTRGAPEPVPRLEPPAFAELYESHADGVFALVTRLLGPSPDREDVLQQAFLQVYLALPRFRGESSVATFVRRIAVHVAIDHLRGRGRRMVVTDPAAMDDLIEPGATPEARAAARRGLLALFTALADVDVDRRVAFVLTAIEGLSMREAAALVGASPDAVKQRALAARRQLELRLRERTSP